MTRKLKMNNEYERTEADKIIEECLSLHNPKSFFLFAGAGSGKTRSLVNALQYINNTIRDQLVLLDKHVAVITFTNAAAEEIKNRTQYDSLFTISTIHSFVWQLIKGFDVDIKKWLKDYLQSKINEYDSKPHKSGTKLEASYNKQLERLKQLETIKHFNYDPAPEAANSGKDSLNHSEVLKICAHFLTNKPLFAKMLVQKFPILLIDESQDTDKNLMEAFLSIQNKFADCFTLGLFGDTKQRIYATGKEDLGDIDWSSRGFKTPQKPQNHRSGSRIIELANKIGSLIDKTPTQNPVPDKGEGCVRLFLAPTNTNKSLTESHVKEQMASITGDSLWNKENWQDKEGATLVLEHRMAAVRMGFVEMWDALKNTTEFDSVKSGTSQEINFFKNFVLPLLQSKNAFDTMKITRKYYKNLFNQICKESLRSISEGVSRIKAAYTENPNITFGEMLDVIKTCGIFNIPHKYDDEPENFELFFDTKLSQIIPYAKYIDGLSEFKTHHGVKGLEFNNVMVIIDNDTKWRTYDETNFFITGNANKDTLRLLYVICTRAKQNLAIILYTDTPKNQLNQNWFNDDEIISLSSF